MAMLLMFFMVGLAYNFNYLVFIGKFLIHANLKIFVPNSRISQQFPLTKNCTELYTTWQFFLCL